MHPQLDIRLRRLRRIEPLQRLFDRSDVLWKIAHRNCPELIAVPNLGPFEAASQRRHCSDQKAWFAILNFKYLSLEPSKVDVVGRPRLSFWCRGGCLSLLSERSRYEREHNRKHNDHSYSCF